MLATIGDLLADRMEPIQRVEKEERLSGKRMRGCGKRHPAILGFAHPVDSDWSAGEIAGQFLQPLRLLLRYQLLGVDRKSRGIPLHELVHELLGKALGVVETLEQKAAETLFDVLEERSGRDGQRQELPLRSKNPLGEKRVDVWVPISAEGAKGLNRRHRAGSDIFAVKKFLETLVDGFKGGLGEKAQQGTFSFKQTAKRLRNAVSKVPMGYRCQDLFSEFFGKQPRPLGLTGRTEVS